MRSFACVLIVILVSVCRSSEVRGNIIMSDSKTLKPAAVTAHVNVETDRSDTDETALKQLASEVLQVDSEEADIKALEKDESELEKSTGTQETNQLQPSDHKDRYEGDSEDDDDDESQGEGSGQDSGEADATISDDDIEKLDNEDDEEEEDESFGTGRVKVQGSIQRSAFGSLWLQVMMGIFAFMVCVAIFLWSKGLPKKLRGTGIGRSMAEMGYSAV